MDAASTAWAEDAATVARRADDGSEWAWLLVADAAAAMPAESSITRGAAARLESMYTARGPVHMLPTAVNNELALSTARPRPALAVGARVDYDGRVAEVRLGEVVAPRVMQVTFDEAGAALKEGKGESALGGVMDVLRRVAVPQYGWEARRPRERAQTAREVMRAAVNMGQVAAGRWAAERGVAVPTKSKGRVRITAPVRRYCTRGQACTRASTH